MNRLLSRSLCVLFLLPLVSTQAFATDGISLNFASGYDIECTVDPGETAGVVPLGGWNNLYSESGTLTDLVDNTGTATAASVTWEANGVYHVAFSQTLELDNDLMMMRSHLDARAPTLTTVAVNNLPSGMLSGGYDVYVYFDAASDTGRVYSGYSIGGQTFWTNDTDSFTGTYVQATGTTKAEATSGANYALFSGLSSSSFELTADPDIFRAEVSGIQVVGASSGEVISMNFASGKSEAEYPMDPAMTAGVVSTANWNNLLDVAGTSAALINDSGAATTADVVWSSNGTWEVDDVTVQVLPEIEDPDSRMMVCYLDARAEEGSRWPEPYDATITVSDLPTDLAENGFDVYVYFEGRPNLSQTITTNYTIGDQTYWAIDYDLTPFDGTYTQATGTTLETATAEANYVLFSYLTGSEFTLTVDSCEYRGDVTGIQIVPASLPLNWIPGDANNDGVVNDADAVIMAANWQTLSGANWTMGDCNLDGVIDDLDATILASNWQSTSSASVPEPGTLALVLGGLLFLFARKRPVR